MRGLLSVDGCDLLAVRMDEDNRAVSAGFRAGERNRVVRQPRRLEIRSRRNIDGRWRQQMLRRRRRRPDLIASADDQQGEEGSREPRFQVQKDDGTLEEYHKVRTIEHDFDVRFDGRHGGEGGIRTHGTCVHLFSRQDRSTAPAPLRGAGYQR